MNTIKRLLLVARPVSWPNTAYPFAAGYLVMGGGLDMTFFIATFFFLIPYNLLMYGINDVFDYESDILNPRKGGIEGMREERALHPLIITASIGASVPFIVYLLFVGSLMSKIVLLGLVFFVLAYSVKGLRFKEKPVLDSITSSIHFVGPLVYALTLTQFTAGAWPFVVVFFLWGMASHAFGAVQDILPDRAGGLHSIATFFGARATVRFAGLLYLAASVLLIVNGGLGIVVGLTGLLYVGNVIRFINISDEASAQTNTAWRRFIWLNLVSGFVVTVVLIADALAG